MNFWTYTVFLLSVFVVAIQTKFPFSSEILNIVEVTHENTEKQSSSFSY